MLTNAFFNVGGRICGDLDKAINVIAGVLVSTIVLGFDLFFVEVEVFKRDAFMNLNTENIVHIVSRIVCSRSLGVKRKGGLKCYSLFLKIA